MGTKGTRAGMPQSEQAGGATHHHHPAVAQVDPQWMKDYMEARISAQVSTDRLEMLKAQYDDGEEYDDDEEEEDDRTTKGGFRTDQPLFGMNPDQTHDLLSRVLDMVTMREPKKAIKGPRARPINGSPSENGITQEDLDMLRAIKNYEEQHPESAEAIRSQLEKYK